MDFQTKNKLTFGVMLLGIFAGSVVLQANAQMSNYCVVDGGIPKEEAFCKKLVSGANTWEQASMWVVNRLMRFTNRSVDPLLKTIDAKLLPSIAPEKKAQIVKTCKDSYADVINGLTLCKKYIKSDPMRSYMPELANVNGCFKDCKEAIMANKGQPEILELNKVNNRIHKILDVMITLANKDPRITEPMPTST